MGPNPNPDIKDSITITTSADHGLKPIGEWTFGQKLKPGDVNNAIRVMQDTKTADLRKTEAGIAKLIREGTATDLEKETILKVQEELTRRANLPALEI